MSASLKALVRLTACAAAASACVEADEGEIVWADWLSDSEIWSLADGMPAEQPDLGSEPAELVTLPAGALHRLAAPAGADRPSVDPTRSGRLVRYDVPLADHAAHQAFAERGVRGELLAVPVKVGSSEDSTLGKYSARVAAFFVGEEATPGPTEVRVVRYEVPADDIALHTTFANLPGEIVEPGMLRLPEVRFFQPKARVYMDLKRSNDEEFDLFTDGSFLASLDVVELYFPMPLVSERFARTFGRSSRLTSLGWRVGATVGLGITTAINDGPGKASGSPISTLSAGIRYEFPLGRPSQELIATGDHRLDERTRVGIEGGLQGGLSTDESLDESTDLGLYFGILVNTPWGG